MGITHAKVVSKGDAADTSLILASDWNANHVGAFEYVKVYRAEQLVIPNATPTNCPFTSAINDPYGYWVGTTDLIVPTGKGGVPFMMWAHTFFDNNVSSDGFFFPTINNASNDGNKMVTGSTESTKLYWQFSPPKIATLADGDVIRLYTWMDTEALGGYDVHCLYTTLTLVRLTI